MQQDLFIEKIVKRKRRGIEVVFTIMLILSAILLILISFFIPILMQQNFFYISTFVSFGIGYLAYRLITGLNCEYEYSITNDLSLIHISEPTRRTPISYAVFCLKKKK